MTEGLSQELEEIRQLLITPTVDSYQQVPERLARVASILSSIEKHPDQLQNADARTRIVLNRLPLELQRLRALLNGPVNFFSEVNVRRAAKFGSYERSGSLRSFDIQSQAEAQHIRVDL